MNKYQQVQEVSNACEGVPRCVAVDYLVITWIKHWKGYRPLPQGLPLPLVLDDQSL